MQLMHFTLLKFATKKKILHYGGYIVRVQSTVTPLVLWWSDKQILICGLHL